MPFLDVRVVQYACGLPSGDIVGGGENKHILRDAMRPLLPATVVTQRPKVGFPVPTLSWLADAGVRDWLGQLVHDSTFGADGLVDRVRFVPEFERAMKRGPTWHEARGIWQALNVDRWWSLFKPRTGR